MLSKGRFTEAQLIAKINVPSSLEQLAEALGDKWRSDQCIPCCDCVECKKMDEGNEQ